MTDRVEDARGLEVGGDDLRSLFLHATIPPVVPKVRMGTICTTRYDEVSLHASWQLSPELPPSEGSCPKFRPPPRGH